MSKHTLTVAVVMLCAGSALGQISAGDGGRIYLTRRYEVGGAGFQGTSGFDYNTSMDVIRITPSAAAMTFTVIGTGRVEDDSAARTGSYMNTT